MGNPGWENRQANRLFSNKPQIPKRSKKGTCNKRMASKYGATKTAQGHTNGHKTKANETL